MDCRVYWNLTRGVWSVQARVKGNWRVIGHASRVNVRDAKFVVSEAGRQRVLREGRKNVHAFVVGWLEGVMWVESLHDKADYTSWLKSDRVYWAYGSTQGQRASYNPYRAGHFYKADTQPLEPIDFAHMVSLGSIRTDGIRRATVFAFDPCHMPA